MYIYIYTCGWLINTFHNIKDELVNDRYHKHTKGYNIYRLLIVNY